MKLKIFLIVLMALFAGQALVAQSVVTGKVIRVLSGDLITVLDIRQLDFTEREYVTPWGFGEEVNLDPSPEKVAVIVHLAEIDAPEKNQPYGETARKKLSEKLLGRIVRVTYFEKDRFDHVVGMVYLGQRWINAEALAEGCAWHDKRYSDNEDLDMAEQQAQARRLGLWAVAKPVAPWEWRQIHQVSTVEYTEPEGKVVRGADSK